MLFRSGKGGGTEVCRLLVFYTDLTKTHTPHTPAATYTHTHTHTPVVLYTYAHTCKHTHTNHSHLRFNLQRLKSTNTHTQTYTHTHTLLGVSARLSSLLCPSILPATLHHKLTLTHTHTHTQMKPWKENHIIFKWSSGLPGCD